METLGIKKNEKNETFSCEYCRFKTRYKSDWVRHLSTRKHASQSLVSVNGNEWNENSTSFTSFSCENCDKKFHSQSGLWKHVQKCEYLKNKSIEEQAKQFTDKDDLIIFLIKENAEYKNMMMGFMTEQQTMMSEQQSMLMKVIENGVGIQGQTNANNSFNNNNNKTFNLQVFLNETCKDAMNITDFVESIKLQLSDLENIGKVGFVEGISNIITTNLKAMDVTQRPVHCTDKKRETMYIKDDNKWTKEDEHKSKIRKAIKTVANKNIRLLPQFREKYPEYNNSTSRISDRYDKMIIEVMTTDIDKEDKIIRNISNATVLDKVKMIV